MVDAVWNNDLECIKYMHENGCDWDGECLEVAVTNGYMECIDYLHKNECPWSSSCIKAGLYHGNLECLRYMCVNGILPKDEYPIEFLDS
jgi:hypothetical protein